MNTDIQSLKTRLREKADVEHVEAYSADNDFSSPDVLIPVGGDDNRTEAVVTNAVEDDETALRLPDGGYMLYIAAGTITSPNGTEWDILAEVESTYEAVLTSRGTDEPAHVGDIYRFDKSDTDYRVST